MASTLGTHLRAHLRGHSLCSLVSLGQNVEVANILVEMWVVLLHGGCLCSACNKNAAFKMHVKWELLTLGITMLCFLLSKNNF